jgi:hypothetical protein
LKGELFSYAIDEKALQQAQLMDGKLMLVTNVKGGCTEFCVNGAGISPWASCLRTEW